jgi:hypothetical protein
VLHIRHGGPARLSPGTALPRGVTLVSVVLLATACGSSTGIEPIANPEEATEAELFDFGQANVRSPSAFDIVSSSAVRLDASSRWDFLFQIQGDSTALLRPRGAVLGITSDAGLIRLSADFDDIDQAPQVGYQRARGLAIQEGDVLAMRSQRDANIALRCFRYGKMEVLSIDTVEGTVTFKHLINPNCENRNLVPGAAVPIEDQE